MFATLISLLLHFPDDRAERYRKQLAAMGIAINEDENKQTDESAIKKEDIEVRD